MSEELGLTMYNKGVGGTGYWKAHSQNHAFYQRVTDLTEQNIDLITIFGSLNDLGTEEGVQGITVIGDITDNKYKTPQRVLSKDKKAIENYSMASINWKATQQILELIERIEKRITLLEEK